MENTEPPLKVVPLPHHPKCVTEHQGRVDKPGTSTWLGNWPSQLYIWRRTCEQYRKPENPIWVILYSGMILPLFWGFIARIKIYFRNHSWISWDFMGFHRTPNGNNPQYLEDSLQGFVSTAHVDCCGPPTISKKSCCIGSSDLHLLSSTRTIIYPHLVPMGMDQDISTPICSSAFLYFCRERP